MLDLVIRNAQLFDGSGSAGFVGDLAVHEGRIVAIGPVTEPAHEAIDTAGARATDSLPGRLLRDFAPG